VEEPQWIVGIGTTGGLHARKRLDAGMREHERKPPLRLYGSYATVRDLGSIARSPI
jgi:hypothetical protein